jgi:holo-[acyl-carrier protein] synthase
MRYAGRVGSRRDGSDGGRVIQGIGTDIVEVARMSALHARHGARLAQRLLAAQERSDYDRATDKARLLAKRFAAKEALAKALGTGLRAPVRLANMGVSHDALGRPVFAFAPDLRSWLEGRRVSRVHLSLSDERHYAVAFVIVEVEA